MKPVVMAAVAAIAVGLAGTANAADPRHPDWPCQQIVVPKLSVTAFWTGPAIDDVGDAWSKDPAVHDLVLRLAERRTPIEEAEKAAADFVTGTSAEKQQKAKLLFAGLFATLNEERSQIMDGIDRFSKRQQQLRQKITAELSDLRASQDTANQDTPAADKLGGQVAWDTRIFEDRRRTIGYVCEAPATVERRLFALARIIQQQLD